MIIVYVTVLKNVDYELNVYLIALNCVLIAGWVSCTQDNRNPPFLES